MKDFILHIDFSPFMRETTWMETMTQVSESIDKPAPLPLWGKLLEWKPSLGK